MTAYEFTPPALASVMPETIPEGEAWIVEEKFDGIRLLLAVDDIGVRAWSRLGNQHLVPNSIRDAAKRLPFGLYDGELVTSDLSGSKSYDVARIENFAELRLVVFDLLWLGDECIMSVPGGSCIPNRDRHAILSTILPPMQGPDAISHVDLVTVSTADEVMTVVGNIWDRGGEGVILKHPESQYVPNRRLKTWIKVKKLHSAVMTIIGFRAGKLGPFSTVLVQDSEKNVTVVKWKDFAWLRAAEAAAAVGGSEVAHPWISRKVLIDFQARTPGGSYRHPRWDRFVEDGSEQC